MEEEVEFLSPFSSEALTRFEAEREGGRKKRVREVCACGHSMNYHSEMNGILMCKPAQIPCNCKHPRAVLEVENLRLFLHSTTGYGAEHALGKGILSSRSREASILWVGGEAVCQSCGEVHSELIPVALNDQAVPLTKSGPINVVVCQGCFVEKFLSRL